MKRKDINSRKEGVTKDMQPATEQKRTFRFPKLGIVVEARSLQEAFKKAKSLKK